MTTYFYRTPPGKLLVKILLAVCLSVLFSRAYGASTAADFGFKVRPDLRGTMPVLVIPVVERGTSFFGRTNTADRYRRMVFGDNAVPRINFRDMVLEMSSGKMRIFPASHRRTPNGVTPLVVIKEVPSQPSYNYGERYRTAVIKAAARFFNFDRYDTDRDENGNTDGKITDSELTVLIVIAARPGNRSAANRRTAPECIVPGPSGTGNSENRKQVCLNIGTMSEYASFGTLAHEILHSWGAYDFYEPNCSNLFVTLMSCTGGRRDNVMSDRAHIDAWHKMNFGWINPRIIDIRQPFACMTLRSPGSDDWRNVDRRPLILYDSRRGVSEYYLLEHRDFQASRSATAIGYETFVQRRGLAIWRVELNEDKNPVLKPAGITPGADGILNSLVLGDDTVNGNISWGLNRLLESERRGDDELLWSRSVSIYDPTTTLFGGSSLWTTDRRRFRLQWTDGSDLGVDISMNTIGLAQSNMDVLISRDGVGAPVNIADAAQAACYSRVTGYIGVNPGVTTADTVFYGIKSDGSLVWYKHRGRRTGNSTWANFQRQRVLVNGRWNEFKQVINGGKGVLYAIKTDGSLVWYRNLGWERGESTWVNRGFERVLSRGRGPGSGWSSFLSVHSAGDGVLYGIKPDGTLVWYQHTGWKTGVSTWKHRGERILARGRGPGSGWSGFKQVISAGKGVLYAIKNDGSLVWYRHTGWDTGARTWQNRGEVVLARGAGPGSGWASFRTVVSGGSGVLYPIKNDGTLVWYRHLDWESGGPAWWSLSETILTPGRGAGTAWSGFETVLGVSR